MPIDISLFARFKFVRLLPYFSFPSSITSYEVPHSLVSSITQLPVILKGILTADDATIAADLGVAAILVSNHGARQLDGTPASVSMDVVQWGSHTIQLQTYF